MHKLNVDLGERSYPIFIGEALLKHPEYLTSYISGNQVAIVTNDVVAPLYLDRLKKSLAGYNVITEILPDGEVFKSLATVECIFDRLLAARFTRKATLIALGGGVVGDMTGFAAACYQRGIDFIQVPTTLLSQVDSSVGGKTGVNHRLGKNMIGAFHQPNAVVIDIETLSTLPDRELSAGLAEVIKYGLIHDEPFYRWLQEHMDGLKERNPDLLAYAIRQSCLDKAKVVAADEKESGIRAILNLGHTFGHAIETHMGYGNWLHGEAVAAGIVMAINLSTRLGLCSPDEQMALIALLTRAGLPVAPPAEMTPDDFLELMLVDKKVIDGRLRLVLLKGVGNAVVTEDFEQTQLVHCLNEMCGMESVV